jgi:hypothetical protein
MAFICCLRAVDPGLKKMTLPNELNRVVPGEDTHDSTYADERT